MWFKNTQKIATHGGDKLEFHSKKFNDTLENIKKSRGLKMKSIL